MVSKRSAIKIALIQVGVIISGILAASVGYHAARGRTGFAPDSTAFLAHFGFLLILIPLAWFGITVRFYNSAGSWVHRGPAPRQQPGGLPEGSRGLRSAQRDDTPGPEPPPSRPRRGRRTTLTGDSGTPPGWVPTASDWKYSLAFGSGIALVICLTLFSAYASGKPWIGSTQWLQTG